MQLGFGLPFGVQRYLHRRLLRRMRAAANRVPGAFFPRASRGVSGRFEVCSAVQTLTVRSLPADASCGRRVKKRCP